MVTLVAAEVDLPLNPAGQVPMHTASGSNE